VYHFEFQNKGCQTTHLGHTGAPFLEEFLRRLVDEWWWMGQIVEIFSAGLRSSTPKKVSEEQRVQQHRLWEYRFWHQPT
jgi:hypothetical protein